MKIAIILTLYALTEEPRLLFERANAENVTWHLFQNSGNEAVSEMCYQLAMQHGYKRVPHYYNPSNPGLAHAWNTGLGLAYDSGADVVMIANDDAIPEPGIVQKIAYTAFNNPDAYLVMCRMLDKPSGHIVNSQFGLCAINPIALETIGYFDQNFFPVYWEDIDYYRRASLAGLETHLIEDIGVTHLGSSTIKAVRALARQNAETYRRNHEYYGRKWGSVVIGNEKYATPFNDPALGLKIEAGDRHAPYPGYDRTDREVVKL